MKKLRLILGDQLNSDHSWYSSVDDDTTYLMAEMRQETDYVQHHIQKVAAFFAAMRNFAGDLEAKGHRVKYLKLDDDKNPQELGALIKKFCKALDIEKFEYQLPDEYRLDEQLKEICRALDMETEPIDTEHFLTQRDELARFFEGKKQFLMESFYRMMRKKHQILMEGDNPEGGKWNFDQSNRKKWTGSPEIPHHRGFRTDVSDIVDTLRKAGVKTIGNIDPERLSWPTSRADSLKVLNHFCKELLVHFGDYQDALHTEEKFLFHSRISFSLNTKMLSPREVIDKVVDHYHNNRKSIDLSQVEGFVRQILGWREYMRGVYWKEMPSYRRCNRLDNQGKLPGFYWTGETKMNCLSHAITQSLDEAYAHHIQRLMITGNYALLTQVHPDEVEAWYLGIYIDAIEWVEMTNTRGMSQYADGGIIATKPYVSSANYINKMSNYCGSCHYKHTKKTGDDACPFNALYWNFLAEKQEHFRDNPRMGMMMSLLDKKGKEELSALKARAAEIITNPDKY